MVVVGRRYTGVVDFVENTKNGFLCETDREMAEQLVYLIDHPEVIRQIKSYNIDNIPVQSWGNIYTKTIEYYSKAISNKENNKLID